jgi:hypothetical protein
LHLPEINLEGLRRLPGTIGSWLEQAQSVWARFTMHLPSIDLSHVKNLPDRIASVISQAQEIWQGFKPRLPDIDLSGIRTIPEFVGSVISQAQEIWQGFKPRLPDIDLSGIRTIPEFVGSVISQAQEIWQGLRLNLPEVNLGGIRELPALVQGLMSGVVETFRGAIESISGLWTGLSDRFQGVMDKMGGIAKFVGKGFVRDLSENSPGPTFQIRAHWQMTAESLEQHLLQLREQAGIAGRSIGQEISAGAEKAAIAAKSKLQGVRASISGALESKGASALGRSTSAIGMTLANVSPQLAMPLFVASDLIDTAKTLSETLPEAKEAFSNLSPALTKLKGHFGQLLPLMQSGFTTAMSAAQSAVTAMIPVIQGFAAQFAAMIPVVIAQLSAMGTAFMATASAAFAAIVPLVTPFLPIIAAIGAVVGAVALLKVAFDNDFLGIRTMVFGVGEAIKSALFLPIVGLRSLITMATSGLKGLISEFVGWVIQQVIAIPSMIIQTATDAIAGVGQQLFSIINPLEMIGNLAQQVFGGLSGAAEWVGNAWAGFSGWFGGAMTGLVGAGEEAGVGLINALNHNPTVRIPLAWEAATSAIKGMMQGTVGFAGKIGELLTGVFSGVGQSIKFAIGHGFDQATRAAQFFGLNALISMAPIGLAAVGVGLLITAIAANFLGLRDIAQGAMKVVEGAIQAVMVVIRGFVQLVSSIGAVLKGVFVGDANLVVQGWQGISSAVTGIISGLASSIQIALGGAIQIVSGLFSGFGQIAGGVFSALNIKGISFSGAISQLGILFSNVGNAIRSAISAPQQAWQQFLGVIDAVESKVRAAYQAVAQSPIGKFTRSAVSVAQGKAGSMDAARMGVDFDDDLANRTAANPNVAASNVDSFKQRVGNFFRRPGKGETTDNLSNSSIDKSTAVQAAAPIPVQSSEPEVEVQSVKNAGIGAAAEAGNAIQNILSILAPGIGAIVAGVFGLLTSFASLAVTIPALTAQFAAMGGVTGIWGAITTAASTAATTGYTAVTGAAAAAGTMISGLGGITGIWGLITTTVTGAIATGFTAVAGAATIAWAAITGPLLPIIAVVGAIAAAVAGLYFAFRNNFLGIGDLFGAIGQGISAVWNDIFGIIQSAWDDSVGVVITQLEILKQIVVDAFQPMFALFGGGGGGLGDVIKGTLFVATLGFRILAIAVGSVIRTVGNIVGAFIVVGQVLTSIFLEPVKAIFAAAGDVKQAMGGLFGAIIEPLKPLIGLVQTLFSSLTGNVAQSNFMLSVLRKGLEVAFFPLRVVFFGIGLAIRAIGFGVVGVIKSLQFMATVAMIPVRIFTAMVEGAMAVGHAIKEALTKPFEGAMQFLQSIYDFVMGIPGQILGMVNNAFQSILGFITSIGQKIAEIPVIGSIFSAVTGIQPGKQQQPQAEPKKFAKGGYVGGGSGVADTINALLRPGEFVFNPEAVGIYGALLPMMNAGKAGIGAIGQFIASQVGGEMMGSGLPAVTPSPQLAAPSLSFAPQPMPQLVPAPVAAAPLSGSETIQVEVNLNVDSIIIGGDTQAGTGSSQAMAFEILEQLQPHLRHAVAEALREMIDRTR